MSEASKKVLFRPPWVPGTKRAGSYPPEIWRMFVPQIQALFNQGLTYDEIVKIMQRDPAAKRVGFQPTKPQLELQKARLHHRAAQQRPALAMSTHDHTSTATQLPIAQTPQSSGVGTTVPGPFLSGRTSPLPNEVRVRRGNESSGNSMPSLNTSDTTESEAVVMTPSEMDDVVYQFRNVPEMREILGSQGELAGVGNVHEHVKFPVSPTDQKTPALNASRRFDLWVQEDLPASTSIPTGPPSDHSGTSRTEDTTSSGFGTKRAYRPPHLQPLPLEDNALNLAQRARDRVPWLNFILRDPTVLEGMTLDMYLDAMLLAKQMGKWAQIRACALCMNMVWAYHLLDRDDFLGFLNHLLVAESAEADETQKTTARTFEEAYHHAARLVKSQSDLESVRRRLLTPVDIERFGHMSI